MNQALRMLLLLSTAVGFTACSPKQPPASPLPDTALRQMFGIKTITGSFTLPSQKEFYEVAVCKYEDGKLIHYSPVQFGGPAGKQDRELKAQLLWGNVDGRMIVSVSRDSGGGTWEDAFWKSLDGGYRSIPNTREVTPEGWAVLGYATSATTQNGTSDPSVGGPLSFQLGKSKRLGALMIRPFENEEEWRRAINERSKTNPAPTKARGG